jgi:hypothetical protein
MDGPRDSTTTTTQQRIALNVPTRRRVAMILFNYIPFLNVLVMAAIVALAASHVWPGWTAWLVPAWLLVVPPVVVRIALALRPLPQRDDIGLDAAAFLIWWFTAQWQVIFNRLPWIEEMIRLVPGLYSTWLRLWGARVGKFVYWTPGLRILDRPLVEVGSRVVFGAGVKINPHVILPDASGRLVLKAAAVRIGDDALVGGYSILSSGSWIDAGEASPGKRDFRPFTGWSNGRRVAAPRATEDPDEEVHAS